MLYGYDPDDERGYVRAIWDGEPSPDQRRWARDSGEEIELAVLELDAGDAPTEGFWRISNGQLVECIGPPDEDQMRRHRKQLAREERQRQRQAKMPKAQPGRARDRS